MSRSCKRGYIRRKASSRSRSSCIKDVGRRGKGPKVLPKLKEGSLTKYGYSTSKSKTARHRSINKAVKAYGPLSVSKKLNVLAVYNKRSNPKVAKIAKADRKYAIRSQSRKRSRSRSRKRSRSRSRKRSRSRSRSK